MSPPVNVSTAGWCDHRGGEAIVDVEGDRTALSQAVGTAGYVAAPVECPEHQASRPPAEGGDDYNRAIVGSWRAAFAGALAPRRSLTRVLIEQGQIGGTCLNVGRNLSEPLLAAAEAVHTRRPPVRGAAHFGGRADLDRSPWPTRTCSVGRLHRASTLEGVGEQRSPRRVVHRRADPAHRLRHAQLGRVASSRRDA